MDSRTLGSATPMRSSSPIDTIPVEILTNILLLTPPEDEAEHPHGSHRAHSHHVLASVVIASGVSYPPRLTVQGRVLSLVSHRWRAVVRNASGFWEACVSLAWPPEEFRDDATPLPTHGSRAVRETGVKPTDTMIKHWESSIAALVVDSAPYDPAARIESVAARNNCPVALHIIISDAENQSLTPFFSSLPLIAPHAHRLRTIVVATEETVVTSLFVQALFCAFSQASLIAGRLERLGILSAEFSQLDMVHADFTVIAKSLGFQDLDIVPAPAASLIPSIKHMEVYKADCWRTIEPPRELESLELWGVWNSPSFAEPRDWESVQSFLRRCSTVSEVHLDMKRIATRHLKAFLDTRIELPDLKTVSFTGPERNIAIALSSLDLPNVQQISIKIKEKDELEAEYTSNTEWSSKSFIIHFPPTLRYLKLEKCFPHHWLAHNRPDPLKIDTLYLVVKNAQPNLTSESGFTPYFAPATLLLDCRNARLAYLTLQTISPLNLTTLDCAPRGYNSDKNGNSFESNPARSDGSMRLHLPVLRTLTMRKFSMPAVTHFLKFVDTPKLETIRLFGSFNNKQWAEGKWRCPPLLVSSENRMEFDKVDFISTKLPGRGKDNVRGYGDGNPLVLFPGIKELTIEKAGSDIDRVIHWFCDQDQGQGLMESHQPLNPSNFSAASPSAIEGVLAPDSGAALTSSPIRPPGPNVMCDDPENRESISWQTISRERPPFTRLERLTLDLTRTKCVSEALREAVRDFHASRKRGGLGVVKVIVRRDGIPCEELS